VSRRIVGLAALQCVAALAITSSLAATPSTGSGLFTVTAFVAAFTLAGLLPVHVEFGRGSYALVLDEAVLVIALFHLSPRALVVAAVAGDLLSRLAARQAPVKTVYNLASWWLAVASSAAVFAAAGSRDASDPAAWAAAVGALAALAAVSLASISTVLALVEQRRWIDVVVGSAGPQGAAAAANVSLGLAVVALSEVGPAAPVVLAPLVAASFVMARRHAHQAAERLRFERLYAAAGRTGGLAGFDEALTALAAEARTLVTGSLAVCCALRNGHWVGIESDDRGTRPADPATVELLATLAGSGETRTVTASSLAPHGGRLPGHPADLVVAAPARPARADVVLAVFRDIAADGQGDRRHEVLGAFAGHAALIIANALLYEEVDAALRRELDLNRQKSEFVAAVSHELRTPLTTVLGAVSTVQRLGSRLEGSTQQKLLTRALNQGDRLRRLIDELLLVAATEHSGLGVDLAPTDLASLLEDTAIDLAGVAAGRLRLDLAAGVPVITDHEKVRRIVTNLVGNAAKYAPDGPITVSLRSDDRAVTITVADCGPGIAPADRDRVFEPFVQLDQSSTRRQGGTGLGLHLCRQLARLLDGRLDLDDAPGGGSRFTLTIPARPLPTLPPPVPGAATLPTVLEGAVR
jgi:signal transduction histidine kinase